MRSSLLPTLLLALSGCSLVVPPDRHQGGDGGPDPCDVDRDGFRAVSCGGNDCDDTEATRYPAAVALCEDGVTQACSGSIPFVAADLFAATGELGRMPTATVRSGGTLAADLAVAAASVGGGGYGIGSVFTRDLRGDTVMHPLRVDVPLGAPASATVEPMLDASGAIDLSLTATVTSVDARALSPSTSGKMGVLYVDSAGETSFEGLVDHAGGTSRFYVGAYAGIVDEPGIFEREYVRRSVDTVAGTATIMGSSFDGPALAPFYVGGTIPTDPNLRMVTTGSRFFMLQNGAGGFWFAEGFSGTMEPILARTILGQLGRAAWVAGATTHALAYRDGATFRFDAIPCTAGGSPTCVPHNGTGSPLVVASGALGGEMLQGLRVQGDHLAFLFVRNHTAGDELLLQLVAADVGSLVGTAISLLDLRASGGRVRDARMDVADGTTADGLIVAALIGDGATPSDRADRLVVTGLRACAMP